MSEKEGRDYYVARRARLLRGFEWFSKRVAGSLTRRYGATFADAVRADARAEFDRIIPEIPYIGGRRNIYTPVMIVNAWGVAFLRAMQARGKSAEDLIRVCAEVSDDVLRIVPGFLLRLAGRLAFTPLVKRVLRKHALRSQLRRYPEDFVYTLREGNGDDWALVFEECAVNKFYAAQGVEELKPYCNFFDVTYSRLMNMGVDARETIGLGCATCSLRCKRGRETIIPDKLRGVLPRT
jgi:hypothetical protein